MNRFRSRAGFGIAGGVLLLAALLAALLFAMGLWRWFVRETAPALVDLPGGGWTAGAVLGLLSVAGWIGGAWFSSPERDRDHGRTGPARIGFAIGGAVCWTVAFGALMYVFGALPGRNCRPGRAMCAYIPGTGSAFLAYAATAVLLGGLWYRRRGTVTAARRAQERDRMRRLRKKGGGRSRAARGR
ncbi:hypothetical protein [Streptomyces sp. NPDC060002]|uniref:hypothetical protein n=1 Tax=Streptomyces sp. NPDC060002 TaxID=3347033 RepID=UPI0036A89080